MKYLKVFTDFTIDMESLNYEERGRLFTAMLEYAGNGSAPPLPGNERFLWSAAKKLIDAQRESYERRCEINKTNRIESLRIVSNRDESSQEQEQEQEQEQNKKKKRVCGNKFRAPSLEEVKAYCSERGNKVNAEQFVSFYESKGWKVGNSSMKDWKAAVRTWEQRDQQPKRKSDFAERTVTDDDFKDLFLPL